MADNTLCPECDGKLSKAELSTSKWKRQIIVCHTCKIWRFAK